ncbi:unnamed protein product [Diatraea saccharalis]|uniref:Uncharacterized protein n=1 Tax=Diatraea saccharalis TaxID=40085 RepID=A0A9P0C639_9NEOP|nr:unnamed protein product [Diatraea saccharalis]
MLSLLENTKLSTQLSVNIKECLHISITLLQYLKCEEPCNIELSQKVFKNIVKFYKESKKKLEFIIMLLDGENLETVFSYLDTDYVTVINVCENILFQKNKKSFFASYLQTLIRKNNIDDLISEKGDNIQSVLKIMDTFFAFPNGRVCVEYKFLNDFIDVFVSCYRLESQLVFAFYVMVTNCLQMEQNYVTPAMNMNPITFNENSGKIKRNIFLKMLDVLLKNEVDISVRLSDTLGVNIPKIETKKTFLSFLETVMMGQLKLVGKSDKVTFEIIKTALKLDPSLVETRIDEILPSLMCIKKSISDMASYTQMMNFLLETYFKLGRGTIFFNKILPLVKKSLDATNTEQEDLQRKLNKSIDNNEDVTKTKNKMITAYDILPEESVDLYGKLTTELMFRQNKDLLISLQKDFEDIGLHAIIEGKRDPSTIIITEVMSAILSSFFKYCKMADHTVPLQIAEEFWLSYKDFESNCLRKFGESLIEQNFDSDSRLILSFLKLCRNFSYLKLLNVKYSNTKLEIFDIDNITSEVFDMSVVLPYLTTQQWTQLIAKITTDEATLLMDEILLIKTMIIEALNSKNSENGRQSISETKSYLVKQLSDFPQILEPDSHIPDVLLVNLDKNQLKKVSKLVINKFLSDSNADIFKMESVCNNKQLLNALLLETVKNILKCFENAEHFAKAITKSSFEFKTFAKETDVKDLFLKLSMKENEVDNELPTYMEILKHIQIYYLEENYQLLAIFVLLAIKNNCRKKLRRNVDYILQSIFELSSQPPDLYKIFPIEFIFSFEDRLLIDLLSLKIKTANNFLPIKCLLESAVKRVKIEKHLVINIVELLLKKQSKFKSTSIESFSDPAFQITCIILPLIVKQKKFITLSAHRSILADLQEKLHKSLLECFKNVNFEETSSSPVDAIGNTDDSMAISDSTMATLNAISAYSLTLSKYCESTDTEDLKNLDCLWSGLEYFIHSAMQSIQNPETKHQHVESSIQLLNAVLRYIKKLETHEIFQTKDKLFIQIWNSIKTRLSIITDSKNKYLNTASILEDISVTIKFLCEWVSVDGFVGHFVADISTLSTLEVSFITFVSYTNLKRLEHIIYYKCAYIPILKSS